MSCTDLADGILASDPTIVTFCERCGDRVPGLPHAFDGSALDLATTYVKVSADRYDNLAAMTGCSTNGAAPSLRVEHDHGEVIVPEHAAGRPVVIVAAAVPHYDLAIGGGALAMVCVVVAARQLRRRRRHRPRL